MYLLYNFITIFSFDSHSSQECWLVSLSNNVLELQLKYLKEGNEKLRNQVNLVFFD
jgi:hypothetical protein